MEVTLRMEHVSVPLSHLETHSYRTACTYQTTHGINLSVKGFVAVFTEKAKSWNKGSLLTFSRFKFNEFLNIIDVTAVTISW